MAKSGALYLPVADGFRGAAWEDFRGAALTTARSLCGQDAPVGVVAAEIEEAWRDGQSFRGWGVLKWTPDGKESVLAYYD